MRRCDARCTLQSMVNVLDSLVGNLTAALTSKGMMDNLIFVYSVHISRLPFHLIPRVLLQHFAHTYICN